MLKKLYFIALLSTPFLLLTHCTNDEMEYIEDTAQENYLQEELEEASSRNRPIIPGKYIVVLKQDSTLIDRIEDIKEIAKGLANRNRFNRDSIKQVYGRVFQGFSIHLNPGQLRRLEKEQAIDYIIPDRAITLAPPSGKGPKKDRGGEGDEGATPPPQSIPWGVSRVGGVGDGTGKTAWIVDSGVDLDHPDLNVDQTRGFSAFKGKERSPDDRNGHGTHVAGTIAALDNGLGVVGVAAGATVVPVKVLDSKGSGSYSAVLAGVDHVARYGQPGDVANLSLGGPGDATVDNAIITAAASSGVKFILAAGNEAVDVSNVTPARANGENVYTISAMDSNNRFAYFSNYGAAVDYCAPGIDILSTYYGGGYATLNGTSMAAPHAAGVLLLGAANTDGQVNNDPDGSADFIIVR